MSQRVGDFPRNQKGNLNHQIHQRREQSQIFNANSERYETQNQSNPGKKYKKVPDNNTPWNWHLNGRRSHRFDPFRRDHA